MSKPRRELRNVAISAKVTATVNKKVIKKCEREGISLSEYLNRLVAKDIKKGPNYGAKALKLRWQD